MQCLGRRFSLDGPSENSVEPLCALKSRFFFCLGSLVGKSLNRGAAKEKGDTI